MKLKSGTHTRIESPGAGGGQIFARSWTLTPGSFLLALAFLAAITVNPECFAQTATNTAASAKKPAGPKPLTPEQHALHLPYLPPDAPKLAEDDLVHQTVDGMVVIEAEHFTAQRRDMIRRWYLNSAQHTPAAKPDGDPVNVDGAGGGAYMEALPDTFVTDDDRAIDGINLGFPNRRPHHRWLVRAEDDGATGAAAGVLRGGPRGDSSEEDIGCVAARDGFVPGS